MLVSRNVSVLCGKFLDSKASKILIKRFVRKNNIDTNDYYIDNINSFNDFFTRKIKENKRPIDYNSSSLISPCDAFLSVYKISEGTVIPVKQSSYTISSLLCNSQISEKYKNGICLVFRLCVDHYHRYCYVDSGEKGGNFFLPGILHTVRPIALEKYPVFSTNCREYTVIKTDNFGEIVQMEVGAMLVGKIHNYHEAKHVERGEEKGLFLYGGSTIIVLLEEGRAEITVNTLDTGGYVNEFPVIMGQKIGEKII